MHQVRRYWPNVLKLSQPQKTTSTNQIKPQLKFGLTWKWLCTLPTPTKKPIVLSLLLIYPQDNIKDKFKDNLKDFLKDDFKDNIKDKYKDNIKDNSFTQIF